MDPQFPQLLLIVLVAAVGSAVNSIAGGGTLLTFPALVGLGVPGLVANATSTVALVPGSIGAVVGYRDALSGSARWSTAFAIASLLGGAVGAGLLLVTPADRFDAIVPWLVFGATALFIVQQPLMRLLKQRSGDTTSNGDPSLRPPPTALLVFQFVIAIYGGYFGAGLGILMLAALGFMGFSNIHRMNGIKSLGGMCANLIAAATFALSNLVNWPVAVAMAVGAIAGGYGGSRLAQRVSQAWVRRAIILIGLASGVWLLAGGLSPAAPGG
ncbi:MAG: sulfite exporter TauE/SafE family protein [Gemmatimonadaceae bacterium]|nr:sulfite exporter TauE/SafE family protein [Gemmatimonadaceae bacterium]